MMTQLNRFTLSCMTFALMGAATLMANHHEHKEMPRENPAHSESKKADKHMKHGSNIDALVAVMMPTEGSSVSGTVKFDAVGKKKVKVTADITGLDPDSEHAIHVHEFGDIRAEDGTAAGGHYNPQGHPHALPEEEKRHAGDFGNLSANADGEAQFSITVDNISLAGKKNPVIGRAVIIHAKADDGGQPTGNAGERLAQGVIGVLNPEN